jgi:hypothetical protein
MSTSTQDVEVGGLSEPILLTPPPLSSFEAPFRGVVPVLKSLLSLIFWLITELLLLPVNIILLPFSMCCGPRYKGVTPAELRRASVINNVSQIKPAVDSLKHAFRSGATRSHAWREQQILAILALVKENEDAILSAYSSDIGKPKCDWFLEKQAILGDANHMVVHLRELMQIEKRSIPLWMLPGSTYIVKEPLGTALVIGPCVKRSEREAAPSERQASAKRALLVPQMRRNQLFRKVRPRRL